MIIDYRADSSSVNTRFQRRRFIRKHLEMSMKPDVEGMDTCATVGSQMILPSPAAAPPGSPRLELRSPQRRHLVQDSAQNPPPPLAF